MGKSEFVGVDGCRSGWFSVGFDSHGRHELKVFPALASCSTITGKQSWCWRIFRLGCLRDRAGENVIRRHVTCW